MGSLLAYEAQNNVDLTKFLGFTHRNFLSQLLPWRPKEKGTRWKSTPGVFTQLTAHCQNDHNHLRYQVQSQNGTWTFDISTEAAYPQLLAARFAAAVKKFLLCKIFPFLYPQFPEKRH